MITLYKSLNQTSRDVSPHDDLSIRLICGSKKPYGVGTIQLEEHRVRGTEISLLKTGRKVLLFAHAAKC